ncbi:Plant UBX domain-containing protein 1 [Glycine max]|nr:Plant UBX domain-containing protein 1 [Glycine max]
MVGSFTLTSKRRRVVTNANLAAAKEGFGREIHVFETSALSSSSNAERRLMTSMSLLLKIITDFWLLKRKINSRRLEKSEKRKRLLTVIRVCFPDNHTLEATFHPSETIQNTTLPKKVINDMSRDFYAAGFCPGLMWARWTPRSRASNLSYPLLGEHEGRLAKQRTLTFKIQKKKISSALEEN